MHVLLYVSEIEDGRGFYLFGVKVISVSSAECMSSYLYSVLYASKDVMAIG